MEQAEQAARQSVNYQRGNQGDVADLEQEQSSTQLLVDCEIQTCQTVINEASTQVSALIAVCYVVPELPGRKMKAELLDGDNEAIKFYTGLSSWKVFQHLITFLCNCRLIRCHCDE